MGNPQVIAMIVADACRFDSMYPNAADWMPYLNDHSTHFLQARSPACWTLPSHASMFSGLWSHQHGATTQTRKVPKSYPPLPQLLKDKGYHTVMVTANVVTTDVFGLDRGFEEMHKIWKELPNQGNNFLYGLLGFLWRPRFRNRIFKSFMDRKISQDVEGLRVFFRSYGSELIQRGKERLSALLEKNKKVFLYINTYDTHFPYHATPKFQLKSEGVKNKVEEFFTLLDIINNRHLTVENYRVNPDWMEFMKSRQREAAECFSVQVDEFSQWLRQQVPESTIIYCSDHGEQFGEENGLYHFNNVTEGGNRVPLLWSRPGQSGAQNIDTPVSLRDVFPSLMKEAGYNGNYWHVTEAPENSLSIIESYWYDAHGKTKPKHKHNQFAFVDTRRKYIYRNDSWYSGELDADDTLTKLIPSLHGDPIEECTLERKKKEQLRLEFNRYLEFKKTIPVSSDPSPAAVPKERNRSRFIPRPYKDLT